LLEKEIGRVLSPFIGAGNDMDVFVGNLTDLNFRGEVWTVGRQGGGRRGGRGREGAYRDRGTEAVNRRGSVKI
jgi:hypothetical protein